MAAVEINSGIAERTVNSVVKSVTADLIVCRFGDTMFRKYILKDHECPLMQQMIVLNLNSSQYFNATEFSMLYVVLLRAESASFAELADFLKSIARPVVNWAHLSESAPVFCSSEDKLKVMNRFPFWKMINLKVKKEGPLAPVNLFKKGFQTLYSKTKRGVEISTQAQLIIH